MVIFHLPTGFEGEDILPIVINAMATSFVFQISYCLTFLNHKKITVENKGFTSRKSLQLWVEPVYSRKFLSDIGPDFNVPRAKVAQVSFDNQQPAPKKQVPLFVQLPLDQAM